MYSYYGSEWTWQLVMAMKTYLTLSRLPELEHHHQMKLSVIPRTLLFGAGVTPSAEDGQHILSHIDRMVYQTKPNLLNNIIL